MENNKKAIAYINKLMDNILDEGATYDIIAVLCTLKAMLEKGDNVTCNFEHAKLNASEELTKEKIGMDDTYLDCMKEIKQHIREKIKKSFDYDYGLSDNSSDRLFTETIIELDLIENMIDKVLGDDKC